MNIAFLDGVSWGHFWVFSMLVSVCWALWIYKDSILNMGRPPDGVKRIWQPTEQFPPPDQLVAPPFVPDLEKLDEEGDGEEGDEEDNEYALMDKLIEEIENAIIERRANPILNDLLTALHAIFLKYPSVAREPFQNAIHNYITKLSYKELQLEVAPADLEPLWG